jgi:hypothetical protein
MLVPALQLALIADQLIDQFRRLTTPIPSQETHRCFDLGCA